MPLDFRLLSMSELRGRPGEILDRVAEEGEAFVIEKGGRRKACLVPLSVFFPDVAPTRIANEMDELRHHGETARVEITDDREFALRFTCELRSDEAVEVRIVLPHGYPSTPPRVYAEIGEGRVPHRWHDGALCLYGVMSGWNPGRHTTLSTLRLTREWLDRYDAWRRAGVWPSTQEPQ
jgi:prevent-host-death family protein